MCILPHTCRKSPERACIEIAIKKFKNHARIMNMNKNIPKTTTSSYHEMETDSLKKMINNLNSRKVEHLEESKPIAWKALEISLLSFYILFGMMK